MKCAAAVLLMAGLLDMAPRSASAAVVLGQVDDFTLLALEGGNMIINSATSISGNVGYSDGVTSKTNQKVDVFTGAAYIHSGASVTTTPATFAPSLGTVVGGAADAKLDQANLDAIAAAAFISGLAADYSLGVVGDNDNRVVHRIGAMTIVDITSLHYKTDMIEFVGDAGGNDQFIVRISGTLNWDSSQVKLTNVLPDNLIWYFPNASGIFVGKAETIFAGTILAPTGHVEYHNPATFNGRIIARDIDVHSDFNISATIRTIPTPAALPAGLSLMGLTLGLRRRRAAG